MVAGDTLTLPDDGSMDPTPLSIETLIAPMMDHDSDALSPAFIVAGLAVKLVMTGG